MIGEIQRSLAAAAYSGSDLSLYGSKVVEDVGRTDHLVLEPDGGICRGLNRPEVGDRVAKTDRLDCFTLPRPPYAKGRNCRASLNGDLLLLRNSMVF